ncbi:MAG TPA: carboxypeptidase regulatory-like domain-containing protein [Nitrospirota bacterium]|nr:carboxypeptidase regulatory-like domain-containing protein [Nitrospirota bacterium]
MKKKCFITGAFAVLFSFSSTALAYEIMEIKNAGSIEGTVEFSGGNVPNDQVVEVIPKNTFCGNKLLAGRYLIKDRKIKNVVVYIEDIRAGKPIPNESVTLTNLKCAFVPHVAIGFKGNNFIERNDDPIPHNIHTYRGGMTMYNVDIAGEGKEIIKPLTKAGLIEVECDTHHWMHGYIYVTDHPYATVTNDDGEFFLKDVPPGTYTIVAWHEMFNKIKAYKVIVESGKATKLKLEYKK